MQWKVENLYDLFFFCRIFQNIFLFITHTNPDNIKDQLKKIVCVFIDVKTMFGTWFFQKINLKIVTKFSFYYILKSDLVLALNFCFNVMDTQSTLINHQKNVNIMKNWSSWIRLKFAVKKNQPNPKLLNLT
jgi:hypothetical protein